MATKAKKICLHQLALAKRQTLSCVGFEDLPNELMIGIFSYLNMKDLIKCGKVSERFRAIVLDEQGRRKEDLLKIIQELQCFSCKEVPAPKEVQDRFWCENSINNHSLCAKHKKCPCGSLVNKNPSELIIKNVENLPMMCRNYQWGCCEVKMDLKNLEIHHGKCTFRRVFCPNPDCRDLSVDSDYTFCYGKKICFKDIFDHLNTDHKDDWYEINGEANEWTDWILGDFTNGTSWYPGKMTSTNGEVFSWMARVHRYVCFTFFTNELDI